MSKQQIKALKKLKEKFRNLPAKQRESIGICFLKVKLGVNTSAELKTLRDFLEGFKMGLVPENLDNMINFFHSEEHSLPEFIAMEDSLSDIPQLTEMAKKYDLPKYDPDDVETLPESIAPFK